MKKMTRSITLLLSLLMVLMMSQAAFAEPYSVDGGTYTFNGSQISNGAAASSIDAAIKDLEPGDTVSLTYKYVNKDSESEETDWYLNNQILDTLEDTKATGGGYSYKLVNHGKSTGNVTLFDSNAVGGQDTSIDEGLKQVNKAITGDGGEKFIYIDTLAYGEGGSTEIIITLEGESQPNSYETKTAELSVAYAVEKKVGEETTIYKHVNTGDTTNILLPAIVFIAALVLLILSFKSIRKDRKDGEEA